MGEKIHSCKNISLNKRLRKVIHIYKVIPVHKKTLVLYAIAFIFIVYFQVVDTIPKTIAIFHLTESHGLCFRESVFPNDNFRVFLITEFVIIFYD